MDKLIIKAAVLYLHEEGLDWSYGDKGKVYAQRSMHSHRIQCSEEQVINYASLYAQKIQHKILKHI